MPAPQSQPILGKARDSGTHPLQPVTDTTPPPAAAPVATAGRRVLKAQGTWRFPVDLLDRLDQYASDRKRETGESKEAIVTAALDDYLKARGA
jgi:hypothetical protein